MLSRRSSKRA